MMRSRWGATLTALGGYAMSLAAGGSVAHRDDQRPVTGIIGTEPIYRALRSPLDCRRFL